MLAHLRLFAALIVVGLVASACSSTPATENDKTDLHDQAQSAMSRIQGMDAGLHTTLSNAYGYAIFPDVGKGAVGVGGAWGRGEVYQQGSFIGYATITQATVGLQLGGQSFNELLIFESKEALDNFKSGNFAFEAGASAVAVKSGASAEAKYSNHVMVFTDSQAGLAAGAAIGGQKFSFQAGGM